LPLILKGMAGKVIGDEAAKAGYQKQLNWINPL
jgi:hypothetical protein